jgi:hypothetical protein
MSKKNRIWVVLRDGKMDRYYSELPGIEVYETRKKAEQFVKDTGQTGVTIKKIEF